MFTHPRFRSLALTSLRFASHHLAIFSRLIGQTMTHPFARKLTAGLAALAHSSHHAAHRVRRCLSYTCLTLSDSFARRTGARTHRFGGSLPSRPVAVLIRAAWPCQDSPLMGTRDRCTGWEDKATVTGRISDLSIALSGGSNRSKLHFPINRNRAGPGGRMRAGTRRPSPCRVSIGRAK